jgi:hypothetical protein|tara:strand:- start:141 stop:719 length:579 start_codon:yes stop_codon:yes gene_type:complete
MNKLFTLLVGGIIFISCEKTNPLDLNITYPTNPTNILDSTINYKFNIVGRCPQDSNGYYHLSIDTSSLQQTLHRFGAHVTNKDIWGLPTQVIWRSDAFWYLQDTIGYTYIEIGNVPTGESPWSWENFAVTGFEGMTVPIVNGTSYADPNVDSVFCMMAPVGEMIGDTVVIYGRAIFEEGDIKINDSFNIIFK